MPTFSSMQIPPPQNWQEFEDICRDIWEKIWQDPNTQKNGRQGQPQNGVDIYGRPNQGKNLAGVQCKGKDNFTQQTLTESEIREEIEKAKKFTPEISQFTIATTAPREASIQQVAREITREHLKKGLFSVNVWSWEDIQNKLVEYEDIFRKHYPQLFPNTEGETKEFDELKKAIHLSLKNETEIKDHLSNLGEQIKESRQYLQLDISSTILTTEHQAELDHAKALLDDLKPTQALDYLEQLRKRIWESAVPIVRYRILTNIASAKLYLNQEQEAAKFFLEALQYNPEDEKALCNAALGYLLLQELEHAEAYAREALEKNPVSERGYAILIQATSNDKELEEVVSLVPTHLRSSPEIANAIAHLAMKRNNLPEAEEWMSIAVKNDTKNLPELKGAYATLMLQNATGNQSVAYSPQTFPGAEEKIKTAIQLLTDAWEKVRDTEVRKYRVWWIYNRSLAKRLLGDIKGASEDVKIALEISPSDPLLLKHYAMVTIENGHNKNAIETLKQVTANDLISDAWLLLAETLRNEKKFDESIQVLESFLKNSPPLNLLKEAKRLLVLCYLDFQRLGEAKEIISDLLTIDSSDISTLVVEARYLQRKESEDAAVSLLRNAKRFISESTSFRDVLNLANEFYFLEQFEESAELYERIADKTSHGSLTRRLLNSYYRSGRFDRALEICATLRQKYGPLKFVSEIEIAIYTEIGDLPKASEVCQEYLKEFPEDFNMKLRKAEIDLRLRNFAELDEFLNYKIDINSLSFEAGLQLTFLHLERGNTKKSIEIMYEIRRKYFNNADAHLKYFGLFLGWEEDIKDLLNIDKVTVDTAVCIEDELGRKNWFIIEDRDDADIKRNEITLDHPTAQLLLGKTVGADLTVKNEITTEKIKIIEIKSKYLYALHEVRDRFSKMFPKTPGLWSIRLDYSKKEEGKMPGGFEIVFEQISTQHEKILQIEELYLQGNLTIGAIANLSGTNLLEVWAGLMNKPDVGIKCCLGTVEERNRALFLLNEKKPQLIVDFISLMTIHGIGAAEYVTDAYGKLGIAQSTIDHLQEILFERRGIQSRGFMVIGKEGEKFVREEITVEDIEKSIIYLEGVLQWATDNCETIPCRAALQLNANHKYELDKLFGKPFLDTILIATEKGRILYSEDERLRSFAKSEFGVEGIWTQILLMDCQTKDIIDKSSYEGFIVKLACSNYKHTSINAGVLIEAARQSKWGPVPPFSTVLKMINGNNSDLTSALNVSTNFLYELWHQLIVPEQRAYLILKLLNELTLGRKRKIVVEQLKLHIKRRFILLPIAEEEILSLLRIWENLKLI